LCAIVTYLVLYVVDWIGKASLPAGFIIPDGMGDRVVVNDGSVVTMSADPPSKGSRMMSVWEARSALVCADIQLSGAPTNSTVFAMYAISHEVKDRKNEEWWELDFEFLGREMDAVWINWYQAGRIREHASFYALDPAPRGLYRRFCLDWDIDNHTAIWSVDGAELVRLEMDGTWDSPLALIFSHWVGHDNSARWVGGDSIDERVSVLVRDVVGVVRE
jgi:hypothetical protein